MNDVTLPEGCGTVEWAAPNPLLPELTKLKIDPAGGTLLPPCLTAVISRAVL